MHREEDFDKIALVILPSVRGSRVSFLATTPDGCHCTAMLFTIRRAVAAAVAAVGGAGATDTCRVAVSLSSFSACRSGKYQLFSQWDWHKQDVMPPDGQQ